LTAGSRDASLRLLRTSQSVYAVRPPSGRAGRKGPAVMPPLEILFRQVPEGMEFVAVLLTILGSLLIMVLFGAWWSR